MARKRSLFNIFPLPRSPRRESVIQRKLAEEELTLRKREREREREEKRSMILHCSENENEYANALRWRDGRDWLVYRPRVRRRSFARRGQEWGEIFGQRSQKSLRPLSRLQRSRAARIYIGTCEKNSRRRARVLGKDERNQKRARVSAACSRCRPRRPRRPSPLLSSPLAQQLG